MFLQWSSATEPAPKGGNSEEGEGWKQVPPSTKRKAPVALECLLLLNRFTALKAEERLAVISSRASGLTDPELQTSAKRKQQQIAVEDCLLQRTEAPDLTCHMLLTGDSGPGC